MKMKNKVETRQDLLYLLAQASELEHSLTCQYLYAAFSLKQEGDPGITPEQAKIAQQWKGTITGIAVQEMLHLGLASNLLTSIGGAPYFRRANFPQGKMYTTLGLDMRLAGVTKKTLKRFCCVELPPHIEPGTVYSHWTCDCAKLRKADRALESQAPLLPQPFNYTTIGELYGLIENGFKDLYPEDASKLFIGPPGAQTTTMWKTMTAVTDRASAANAIDLILRQGEGAYGNEEEIAVAHFGRFVDIFNGLEKCLAGPEPALPVVENPVLTVFPDSEFEIDGEMLRPTVITSEVGRDANEIFISLYEIALQVLLRYFAYTDETEEQRYILKEVFLSVMRFCIDPLGSAIARLPAFNTPSSPNAGACFDFYSDTLLLPHMNSAWIYFTERLQEIATAAEQLSSSDISKGYPLLIQALTGVSGNLAKPGVAQVCTKYVVALNAGRMPPGTWTWDNGVRSFFAPLSVLHMASSFNLDNEQDVLANKVGIAARIIPESTVRMPPQFLLEDDEAQSFYLNPLGPWTDERISIFLQWAQVKPQDPFECPENPTWENAVKDWFTQRDKDHMLPRGFDLSSYTAVTKQIGSISQSIESKFMPPGGWSDAQIDCWKKWVAAGTPEGEVSEPLSWSRTDSGRARRYDDVFFINRQIGWAVNSNAQVIFTQDSGTNWTILTTIEDVNDNPIYLRCCQFANENLGFLGTISAAMRLYVTIDGGKTWTPQEDLPPEAPLKVCGLTVVNESVVYCTGTNEPGDFAAIMKTTDGGKTWTGKSLEEYASILIDNHFFDEKRGLVVGGYTDAPRATRTRADVQPVILQTEDGGETWVNLLKDFTSLYPKGEWGWKIDVVDANVIYVSLENFTAGAVSKTTDGGKTWVRLPINDQQGNANLEGVGFINENVGWVGGWGDAQFEGGYTSATTDGGLNWKDANEVGRFINRFRFFGDPVDLGFASGDYIYKYSSEPAAVVPRGLAFDDALILNDADAPHVIIPLTIRFRVPSGTKRLRGHIWNHFGKLVHTFVFENNPVAGEQSAKWDGRDYDGNRVPSAAYIYRLRCDSRVDSRVAIVDV